MFNTVNFFCIEYGILGEYTNVISARMYLDLRHAPLNTMA